MTGFEVVLMIVGAITMTVLVTVTIFIILKGIFKLIAWLWERRHKQAIYWNEDDQQIKTRSGRCILDKINADVTMILAKGTDKRIAKLENQQYTKKLYDKNLARINRIVQSLLDVSTYNEEIDKHNKDIK